MKIDILFKSPCVVFTLSDIFEPSVIEACLDQFPMDKNLFQSDEGGKHRIEHYSRAMAKLLSQSAHWRGVFHRLSADDILSCLNHLEIAEGREPRRYAWESLNPIVNFVNRHVGQKQLVRQNLLRGSMRGLFFNLLKQQFVEVKVFFFHCSYNYKQ